MFYKVVGRFGVRIGAGLALTMLVACSTKFSETHYVGVIANDQDGIASIAQFYRFRLKGESTFSDTRFESGWYDARAIDHLFAESGDRSKLVNLLPAVASSSTKTSAAVNSKQPEGAESSKGDPNQNQTLSSNTGATNNTYFHFGPEGVSLAQKSDERLVIIMHNDPKAITARISTLTNQAETSELLMAAVAGPKISDSQKKVAAADDALAREKAFATRLLGQIGEPGQNGLKSDDAAVLKSTLQSVKGEVDSRH